MDQCNPVIGLWLQSPSGTVTNSQLSVSARFCNCISELSARHVKSYIARQVCDFTFVKASELFQQGCAIN